MIIQKGVNVFMRITKELVISVVCGLLIVSSIVLVTLSVQDQEKTRKAILKNQIECTALSKEIEDFKPTVQTVDGVKSTLVSAGSIGAEIATIQNDLGNSHTEDGINKNVELLRKYFDDPILLGAWGGTSSPMTWQFESMYSYDDNQIPILWTCYDSNDVDQVNLIAYVIGMYDAKESIFYDLELHTTVNGNELTGVPDDTGDPVDELTTETSTEITTEVVEPVLDQTTEVMVDTQTVVE